MLGDLSGVSKIYLITGRTDMRKSFDGLMAIIRDTYQLDPYANAVYLFCGKDSRKLKALHFDKDGFVLLQKRLDGYGRFQWPRNASEARLLSRQEFRWLMEGLAIDQPKAIRALEKRRISEFLYKTEKFKNLKLSCCSYDRTYPQWIVSRRKLRVYCMNGSGDDLAYHWGYLFRYPYVRCSLLNTAERYPHRGASVRMTVSFC